MARSPGDQDACCIIRLAVGLWHTGCWEQWGAGADDGLHAPQAGANGEGNLKNVEGLLDHPAFSITNPNACYSLFLSFLRSPVNFHAADGSGYKFIADSILKAQHFPTHHAFIAPLGPWTSSAAL